MEDLPTEMLCWRRWADTECCQGKGPLVGPFLPFLTGEGGKGPQRLGLDGRAQWEVPYEESQGGSDHELVAVTGFLHIDFQCSTATH